MAQKDITEKQLIAYNDVFSDIVNVLLFDGRREVAPEELTDSQTVSQYRAEGEIHEQERDVAKFWNRSHVHIALLGVENQTVPDPYMALRVIGYDGAAYRAQVLPKSRKPRYPVVTMVLYFGEKPWNKPKTLHECLQIPEDLKPYVCDYRINLFDIPRMPREKVKLFQSDFRIVADYFTQVAQNQEYIPSQETIDHVDEILKLMGELTDDSRFDEIIGVWQKGERADMCEVLDRVEARGIHIGEARGEARGIHIGEARGEARGIHIGEARGAEKATLSNAVSFLKAGVPAETVAQCTGLPLEQVLKLQMN